MLRPVWSVALDKPRAWYIESNGFSLAARRSAIPPHVPHLGPPEIVKRSVWEDRHLVEIDPTRDVEGMTAKTGATVLMTFMGGLFPRLRGTRGY